MGKKVIRIYLAFNAIFYFFLSLEFSTYVIFLKDNRMSFFEVGLINGAFMIACFFFEIPTGVIADYYGRKVSILMGSFAAGIGSLIYFSSYSFWGFILSEVFFAFGSALISGAADAWVKDTLDHNGHKEKIVNVFSKGDVVTRVAALLGGLIGGLIAIWDLRVNWLLTAGGLMGMSFVFFPLIREEYFKKAEFKGFEQTYFDMKAIFVDSISFGYKESFIWNLILMNGVFILGTQAFNMQWSVLFEKVIGFNSVGWIYAVMSIFLIMGIMSAVLFIKKEISEKTIVTVSLALTGFGGMFAGIFDVGFIILAFFLLHEAGRGGFMPVQRALIQEKIPSDKRATVGSFNSMIGKFGAGIGWLLSGIAADYVSISMCWFISSIFFFIAILFARRIRK